ncbi:MAG: PhzF family phenazine biosynthesis protein [Stackebrandtia sp.]
MMRYEIVDVFTGRAFTGNPLAVVLDAEDLTTGQMQDIAREFNLSETAFTLRPSSDEATYRVRIFTPSEELPYAGHPSIGTAVTLARRGDIPPGEAVQECGAGMLSVDVDGEFATLTGAAPTIGPEIDAAPLLDAAGLDAADLAGVPRRAGTGLEYSYLPVKPDAVAHAVSRPTPDVPEVYLFSYDAERRLAHARLFAPGLGVAEDPATGSAALGLGVYLAAAGQLPADGVVTYHVAQGVEIKRPSQLECTVTVTDGAAVSVQVRGQVLPVARGELVVLP